MTLAQLLALAQGITTEERDAILQRFAARTLTPHDVWVIIDCMGYACAKRREEAHA